MQSLPFSESDILSNVDPTHKNKCSVSNPTSLEIEQCRNEQLATWYVEHMHKVAVPSQNLHDLDEHYQREWQTSVHLGIGIVGLVFLLRVIGSL
jgi:hypothetical protein